MSRSFTFLQTVHMVRSFLLIFFISTAMFTNAQDNPVRIGVIGLSHTHVHWIFNSVLVEDFEIVGIVEPNMDLAQRYADQYRFPMSLVFHSLDEFLSETKPDGVTAFGTIYDHLSIVETCAPLGIHVMVEKPLAVNLTHAIRMKQIADEYGIHLLTNYESTWYPTNHKALAIIQQDSIIGDIRKLIVRSGHKGPKKIGVDAEFLEWLTDPELNGGGAIIDFGCYGANLFTWLLHGEKPESVTAVTTQLQSENNPMVDDEAILILKYERAVAIIQASWNWPIGRKDMEIYGLDGAIYADNRTNLRTRIATGYDVFTEEQYTLEERPAPYHDPFAFFSSVIRGEITVDPFDLSSLENNMIVMEILSAAVESASTGQTVRLED